MHTKLSTLDSSSEKAGQSWLLQKCNLGLNVIAVMKFV